MRKRDCGERNTDSRRVRQVTGAFGENAERMSHDADRYERSDERKIEAEYDPQPSDTTQTA